MIDRRFGTPQAGNRDAIRGRGRRPTRYRVRMSLRSGIDIEAAPSAGQPVRHGTLGPANSQAHRSTDSPTQVPPSRFRRYLGRGLLVSEGAVDPQSPPGPPSVGGGGFSLQPSPREPQRRTSVGKIFAAGAAALLVGLLAGLGVLVVLGKAQSANSRNAPEDRGLPPTTHSRPT